MKTKEPGAMKVASGRIFEVVKFFPTQRPEALCQAISKMSQVPSGFREKLEVFIVVPASGRFGIRAM